MPRSNPQGDRQAPPRIIDQARDLVGTVLTSAGGAIGTEQQPSSRRYQQRRRSRQYQQPQQQYPGQRSQGQQYQGQRDQGRQGQQGQQQKFNRGYDWDIAVGQQTQLVFDKGNDQGKVALIIDVSGPVQIDSPAAAVALMHWASQSMSPQQPFFQARLETTLISSYPSPAVAQQSRRSESQKFGDGQLTLALNRIELEYLRYVHGLKSYSKQQLTQLAEQATQIADAFSQRQVPSHRRQFRARCIAADLLQTTGNRTESNQQMGVAIVLAAIAYKPELVDLTKAAFGEALVAQTVTDDPQGRLLVSAGAQPGSMTS